MKHSTIHMFPVKIKGKMGLINCFGQIVLEPSFEICHHSHEGIALVKNNKFVAFFNGNKEFVPILEYSFLSRFSEGLAPVAIEPFKFGYMDSRGSMVITPQFDCATNFTEGIAFVFKNNKSRSINKSGNIVFDDKLKHDFVGKFHEGLARALSNDKRGFINHRGDYVIENYFSAVNDFHDGYAYAEKGLRAFYIDKLGNTIFSVNKDCSGNFYCGLATYKTGNSDKIGFVNKNGQVVIEPQFSHANDFINELAYVEYGSGSNGFININGKMVIDLDGLKCEPFFNGLAKVTNGGSWGYIDSFGQVIWELSS